MQYENKQMYYFHKVSHGRVCVSGFECRHECKLFLNQPLLDEKVVLSIQFNLAQSRILHRCSCPHRLCLHCSLHRCPGAKATPLWIWPLKTLNTSWNRHIFEKKKKKKSCTYNANLVNSFTTPGTHLIKLCSRSYSTPSVKTSESS